MSGEPKSKQDDPKQTPEEALRDWAEESGRALELRVARAFVKAGADDVVMSRRYRGDQTTEPREIDVLAEFRAGPESGPHYSLYVVVECKHSPKNPWIGFLQDHQEPGGDKVEPHIIRHRSVTDRPEDEWEDIWTEYAPFHLGYPASHMTDGHGDMGNGSKHRPNSSTAINQAVSGARGIARELSDRFEYQPKLIETRKGGGTRGESDESAFWVLAVAVTANKIYSCQLDGHGEVNIAERDEMTVRVDVPTRGTRKAFVLQEDAVLQFARDLREMMDRTGMVLRRPEV